MDHLTVEDLSAYMDGELEQADQGRMGAHISGCARCAAELDSLRRASSVVSRLTAEVDIPADDLAALRLSVPAQRGRLSRPGWIAGVAAAGLAAIVGVLAITMQPGRQMDQAATSGAEAMSFTSDAQVREALEDDPQILSAAGRWTVGDVGREADEESARLGQFEYSAPADSSDKRLEESTAEMQASQCGREVAGSQPYPMKSVMSRPALFRGVESWLLVYVYTPERDPEARLDRFQIWIVRTSDCSTLHYSFFRPKQD